MSNIYKQAIRKHVRFDFKGLRSVEELWHLTLEQLDSIFKALSVQRKAMAEETLLSIRDAETTELDLKIEIDCYSLEREGRSGRSRKQGSSETKDLGSNRPQER